MTDALVALHFQNDICRPEGRIPFALDQSGAEASAFLSRCRQALDHARASNWTVAHVHIAFAEDYSDLPRNCRLFLAVEKLGAVKRGSWGAAPHELFAPADGELRIHHAWNSAFGRTGLDALLRGRGVTRVNLIGLATQFSVEHTARDAADLGYLVRVFGNCCGSADREAHEASLRTLGMLADVVNFPPAGG
jgi:nicotinamidase-related amidase